MKQKLAWPILCLCILFAINSDSSAQGTLMHYWHFNSYGLNQYTDTIHGIPADFSIHDPLKSQILYAKMSGVSAAYSTHIDSLHPPVADNDTFNARMGAAADGALRVRNPSDSMQLLFYIPTVHYKNILLKYGVEKSNSAGMLQQVFDYSIDSGANWRTTGLTTTSDSAKNTFHLVATTFGSDTQVNNNPRLVFRIRFLGSNTGTSGNNRFDNVTVDGDSIGAVIPPNAVFQQTALISDYRLYPNPASGTLSINGGLEGDKQVVIYSTTGAQVLDAGKSGRQCALDISGLAPGNYYIRIKENGYTDFTTLHFIKQ